MLPPDAREALAGELVPKFLATVGPDGEPNIVPVISLQPWDSTTLVFGEYLMHKSRRNLGQRAEVGVLVMTEELVAYALRGSFLGFQQSGEWFDRVSRGDLLRYNAYTGIRAAGGIRVEEVSPRISFGKVEVLSGFLHGRVLGRALRRPGRSPRMPWPVAEKFTRLQAVRAGAFVGDDGFPRVFPSLACLPAGPNRLLIADRRFGELTPQLRVGARVAMAILTFDPIAYQVKGTFAGTRGGVGMVDISAVYSASPPRVGDRLDEADA